MRIAIWMMLAFALSLSGHSAVALAKGQSINKAQAAAYAKQAVAGRVLRVEKRRNSFRVKLLQKSGRVVIVDIDQESGKLISKKAKQR